MEGTRFTDAREEVEEDKELCLSRKDLGGGMRGGAAWDSGDFKRFNEVVDDDSDDDNDGRFSLSSLNDDVDKFGLGRWEEDDLGVMGCSGREKLYVDPPLLFRLSVELFLRLPLSTSCWASPPRLMRWSYTLAGRGLPLLLRLISAPEA